MRRAILSVIAVSGLCRDSAGTEQAGEVNLGFSGGHKRAQKGELTA